VVTLAKHDLIMTLFYLEFGRSSASANGIQIWC